MLGRAVLRKAGWILTGWAVLTMSAAAQQAQTRGGLASLFEASGPLLEDANGDGWTDGVSARFWLGDEPGPETLGAASEIAARLGFETMAMDLPLAVGTTEGEAGESVHWLFGEEGIRQYATAYPDTAAESTSASGRPGGPSRATIDWVVEDERSLIVLRAQDDESLHHAAATLAGRWPAIWTPGKATITDLMDAIDGFLLERNVRVLRQNVTHIATSPDQDSLVSIELEVEIDGTAAAAEEISVESLSRVLRGAGDEIGIVGVQSVALSLGAAGQSTRRIELDGRAAPTPDGPVAARPGTGAKRSLDLSNLYTPDGLLGDGDGNRIPDRIDAMLSLGQGASASAIDLAARLGLESAGVQIPIARLAPLQTPVREEAEDEDDGQGGDAASQPTLILVGTQALSEQLAADARTLAEEVGPETARIEIVPEAFGDKPAVVVTGGSPRALDHATGHLANRLPHLDERGDDRTSIDDVEMDLWKFFSGRSPAGQAAIATYKLDRLLDEFSSPPTEPVNVLLSLEKPDANLGDWLRNRVKQRLGPTADVRVEVDDRDVTRAKPIFESNEEFPSEVSEFLRLFETRILPRVGRRRAVRIEARLSEPMGIRRELESHVREALRDQGVPDDRIDVQILSAYKQGYSWLEEVVVPRVAGREVSAVTIRFAKNTPPEEWPQQAMQTPLRWLHEIFPIDEIVATELGLDQERVRFEMAGEDDPTYGVEVLGSDGGILFGGEFEPKYVLRPYIDRFRDYELVKVTTGWIEATIDSDAVLDQRIATDPERFWDFFQADTLRRMYDYVMERHEGNPRGGGKDAPLFGELVVDLELSEPHRRIDVDNELISSIDALHEDIYFTAAMFYRILGRMARGDELTYAGRILPQVRPSGAQTLEGASTPGRAKIRFTGFATSRPAVVVTHGEEESRRLDIPRVELERPSALAAWVTVSGSGLDQLDVRVKVDTENDERDALVQRVTPLQADERILSAAQVLEMIEQLDAMRNDGLYRSSLAYRGLDRLRIFAGWEHQVSLNEEPSALLDAPAEPESPPTIAVFERHYRSPETGIVQWDEPIPPKEAYGILARLTEAEEATAYRLGQSYLGEDVWAMDLMAPLDASHWSRYKATTFKPTVIYSARQHANEVSSTSHVLRLAEQILDARGNEGEDEELSDALDKVNVVIHPITNPDGAQLAYDLYRETPDLILHAGYWASLGMDVSSDARQPMPMYPEAALRPKIWRMWLPDIFLNPHGYPSHQLVQLFSEYTGLVRRGRITERNWSMNKGWFIPGFSYFDDPRFPRHKQAAFEIRDYITEAITSLPEVHAMNQRNYARYDRYGGQFDEEVFRLEMTDDVLIHTAIKGSRAPGPGNERGYDPKVTIWSGSTEAPDETAHGDWLKLVASAGLAWDRAILRYLLAGEHRVDRKHSGFYGGTHLSHHRERPPKPEEEEP